MVEPVSKRNIQEKLVRMYEYPQSLHSVRITYGIEPM